MEKFKKEIRRRHGDPSSSWINLSDSDQDEADKMFENQTKNLDTEFTETNKVYYQEQSTSRKRQLSGNNFSSDSEVENVSDEEDDYHSSTESEGQTESGSHFARGKDVDIVVCKLSHKQEKKFGLLVRLKWPSACSINMKNTI